MQITGAYVASVNAEPECSFCGKTQRQVGKLIAGTGVYICDGCVRIAAEALQHDLPSEGIHDWLSAPPQATERRQQSGVLVLRQAEQIVRKLIAGPGVYICDECVELCVEIIRQNPPLEPDE